MMENDQTDSYIAQPLISVAMPIYNPGRYLRPAVLSILNQSFKNWELFLIDDGSTDNSLSYIADIKDNRIRIIRDGLNKGLAVRLNQAIDLAKGPYFARMDQDDISYPERFSQQLEALKADSNLDLVSVKSIKISMQDKTVGYIPFVSTHQEITASPWKGFYMAHPTWMGRIDWFRKHKYKSPYLCEDQELLLRTYRNSNFLVLNEVHFAYRVRDHIQLKKMFKTRCSVLKMQVNYFMAEKQLGHAILASLFFVSRLCADFVTKLLPLKRSELKLNEGDTERWLRVLKQVNL